MQYLNWDFTTTMEGMSDEAIKERIQKAYDWPMAKLRPIPYVGISGVVVTYESGELIARCPATGYPDTYRLIIDFIPDVKMPELKTLRFYLMDFFTLPISHEHLCAKIYREFSEQIQPRKIYVRVLAATRGGICTTIQLGDASLASDVTLRRNNMSL